MSAFAALSGFAGDDDIKAVQEKRIKDEKEAKEREVEASKVRFDELRTRGTTNWGDSDDDDDFFKSPPKVNAGTAADAPQESWSDREEADEADEDDESAEAHANAVLLAAEPDRVYQKSAKELEKEEAKRKEDEELQKLMAGLDTGNKEVKETADGMSKAAAKRAKKKAKEEKEGAPPAPAEADATPAPANAQTDEAPDAAEAVDGEGCKSAEEVKQALLARTEALKKKKAKVEAAKKSSAAAAAADKKKPKKKQDKSKFNQQPP